MGKPRGAAKKSAKVLTPVSSKPPRDAQSPTLLSPHPEAQDKRRVRTTSAPRSHRHCKVTHEGVTVKAQPSSQAGTDPGRKIVLGQTVAGVGPAPSRSTSLSWLSGGAGASARAPTAQQLSSSWPDPAWGSQSSHSPGTAEQLRSLRSIVTTTVVLSMSFLHLPARSLPPVPTTCFITAPCTETAEPWGGDLCLRTFYLGLRSFTTPTERAASQMALQPAQRGFEMPLLGYSEGP